jgi:hypothetical protein
MSFKDQVAADIDRTFFNITEFGEPAIIDGVTKNVIIDEEALKLRGDKEYGGITTGMLLYFIPVSVYGPDGPRVGDAQNFNGALYYIEDVKGESSGVYEILLSQNRGR